MILISNATTFVGRVLVNRLVVNQREVRCLLRPSRREQQLPTGLLFSTVSASMDDPPALRSAMQGVEAIVHLAGEFDLEQGGALHTHVQDTVNLIEAVREAGVRRFIYVSRLGANRASAYQIFHVLGEAEAIVRESELDYTILQTAITYGPEDMFVNLLVMLAKAMPYVLPIPDTGLARFQPLWIMDLVQCIEATLNRDDLIGQTIPLGGPEHFTFEQLLVQILKAAGMRRRIVRVRTPLIQGAILLCDALLPRTPTPPWWLDLLSMGSATNLVTIQRHFDFDPRRFAECLDYLGRKRAWRRDLLRLVLRP
ncbi:MAG: NAD(P)H-binding protein [Chloroflexota bacterium]|nr:NAD(P)H-binding protein [Chloroflexota bacterium]